MMTLEGSIFFFLYFSNTEPIVQFLQLNQPMLYVNSC